MGRQLRTTLRNSRACAYASQPACRQYGEIRRKIPASGFTLIELMVTIGVLSLLVTLAIPSFGDLVLRNTVDSDANDFVLALNLARSEAIKRNQTVNIKAEAGGWANGYFVELAADNTRIRNFSVDAKAAPPTETSSPPLTEMAFGATGIPTAPVAQFNMCKKSGKEGRSINVSATGRVTVSDLAACP